MKKLIKRYNKFLIVIFTIMAIMGAYYAIFDPSYHMVGKFFLFGFVVLGFIRVGVDLVEKFNKDITVEENQ